VVEPPQKRAGAAGALRLRKSHHPSLKEPELNDGLRGKEKNNSVAGEKTRKRRHVARPLKPCRVLQKNRHLKTVTPTAVLSSRRSPSKKKKGAKAERTLRRRGDATTTTGTEGKSCGETKEEGEAPAKKGPRKQEVLRRLGPEGKRVQ